MKKEKNPGISGLRADSYRSFKKLDRLNLELWKKKYRERTGKRDNRGFQSSKEYGRYSATREERVYRLAEENIVDYIRNADRLEKRKPGGVARKFSFDGVEVYNGVTEILPVIDALEISAGDKGKEFMASLYYGGRYYIGVTAIKQKLSSIAANWRRYANTKRRKGQTYNLFFIDGTASVIEYMNKAMFKMTLKILKDDGSEAENF